MKGLYLPSPSDAVEPAFAAKAISVLGLVGSTLAKPRLIPRTPIVRFMLLLNGLSRHASKMRSRNCRAGSITMSSRSRDTASS